MIKFLDLQSVNKQYLSELNTATERVINSGWYLQGQETAQFESEYGQFIGTNHCVSCGNGLDALTIMLRAYKHLGRINDGDEIIVPANTFLATILSITENNLTPVFVEPSADTLQIDDSLIERHISPRTRAVLLVHLYGISSYTQRIAYICKKYNLLLLEDNAQAHGQKTIDGRRTGSIGDAAAHSFYPGKNLGALGDAGAVTTNDPLVAKTVRSLCNYGFSRRYYADTLGRNSRMDEIQAAVLRVRLSHLDEDNIHRRLIADYYNQHIENPLIRKVNVPSVHHIYPIFCKQRNQLQQFLSERGIETLIHYPIPPHLQECYPDFHHISLPITEQLASEELSLPISPVLSLSDAVTIVSALNEFAAEVE